MVGVTKIPKRATFMLTAALALAGCKEVLYSDLSEVDANEMVSVLSLGGIEASRQSDKDNRYTVLVESVQIPAATIELRGAGLPRRSFQSIGDVFSASSIIGTPFEQHARYIHALNQEIGSMLTAIDGVDDATVIVNAPPAPSNRREKPVATAAITIHHEAGFVAADNLPRIKQLVSHSVPSLPYENVVVAFFERPSLKIEVPTENDAAQTVSAAGFLQPTENFRPSAMHAALLVGLLVVGMLTLLVTRAPKQPSLTRRKSDTCAINDMTGRRRP